MTKIGLFGGTFDPVHYGHLKPVEAARQELGLDEVWILPNPRPPHKENSVQTPYVHRKEMLRLALREFPKLVMADFEEKAVGPAYTTDTVRRVIAELPEANRELWLIVGADSLLDLPKWKDPEALFRDTQVAVLPRPGINISEAKPEYLSRIRVLSTPLIDISATDIRNGLKSGSTFQDKIPPAVLDYIQQHGLYRDNPAI